MANRRGNVAQNVMTIDLMLLGLLFLNGMFVESATYIVGGANGWYYGIANTWPHGETFTKDDLLEFKYDPEYFNVLKVTKADFDKCFPDHYIEVYTSGHDVIPLTEGMNYFISNLHTALDCLEYGMKIAIKAI